MDTRFVFSATYSAWNKLSVHYNTDLVTVTPASSKWMRTVAPLANGAKKCVIVVAFAVSTIVTAIFSVCYFPIRYLSNNNNESLKKDFNRMPVAESNALRQEILDDIDRKESQGKFKIPFLEKDAIVFETISCYARSSEVYGPVVVAWVEYLLNKANQGNQKLVFMARDGIAPYKMAMEMMQEPDYQSKYPNLVGDDKIALAYFSRKVVDHAQSSDQNKALLQKYVTQLGISDGDQCIFVDIGFTGSMITKLRDMLPGITISFDYLISHTPNADGFIFSANDPSLANKQPGSLHTIQSIAYKAAGSNLATHWLEDTHQGVGESPTHLVEKEGKIYPNTKIPGQKQYTAKPGSHDFMLRKWARRAIVRSRNKYPPSTIRKDAAIKKLDDTLTSIKNLEIPLLIQHK